MERHLKRNNPFDVREYNLLKGNLFTQIPKYHKTEGKGGVRVNEETGIDSPATPPIPLGVNRLFLDIGSLFTRIRPKCVP